MALKNKVKKGEYGYIDSMKKTTLVKTLVLFLASACVFFSGYMAFGKKENIVTVFAVLLVLPASRSLVNAIMFMRFSSGDRSLYEKAREKADLSRCFFDSILTLERGGSYMVPMYYCNPGEIFVILPGGSKDREGIKSHLESMLKKNGHKYSVRIVDNTERFFSTLPKNAKAEADDETKEVLELIGAISL